MYLRLASKLKYRYRVSRQQLPGKIPSEAFYLHDHKGNKLSFWNDIALDLHHGEVTCCIQIPKNRIAKMELIKESPFHPIQQDTRKNIYDGQLQKRYYAQFAPFNYGFLPQTWEQNITANELGLMGDNDPLDVLQFSQKKRNIGDIFRAKILGSFCLIDQGQIDWKIIVIDVQQAHNINRIGDIDRGRLKATTQFYKYIKTYDNKKPNTIAHNQKIFDPEETIKIILETHEQWSKLRTSTSEVYQSLRKQFKFDN